jgi:hypothetical protein
MRLLLIPALTLATTLAYGEPAVVAGMGTQPCTVLTARTRIELGYAQNGLAGTAFSWVQGYVSAWNAVEIVRAGRFADLTSLTFDEQWSRIAEFCRRNPDGFVFDAAQNLIATGLKLQSALPMNGGSAAGADIGRLMRGH